MSRHLRLATVFTLCAAATISGSSFARAAGPHPGCGMLKGAAKQHQLLPGIPCEIVLTRYAGLPASPGIQLIGRADVRGAYLLRQLTMELNALRPSSSSNVCPNDDGSEIKAVVEYAHRQTRRLTVGLSGCAEVQQGSLSRSALGRTGERLLKQLVRLTARP
jgi:hypothetical protein